MNKEGRLESKEISELPKKHTSVIGDLDGSYEIFFSRIKEQGLISSNGRIYTGGSKKVVFSGDILADLKNEGFYIFQFLFWLKNQAKTEGGDISVLAGNHEEFIIGYLIGESVNLGVGEISDFLNLNQRNNDNKANGLNELNQFGKSRIEILENMKKDKFGKMILEEICQLKLVDISGDTLFFHTPPTKRMLQMLQGKNITDIVNHINSQWQNILKTLLLGENQQSVFSAKALEVLGQKTQEQQLKGDYIKFADIFLRTANDTPDSILMRLGGNYSLLEQYKEYFACEDSSYYDFLYQQGINTIVYGHTDSILQDHKIRFIDVNQRSIELNKPQDNQTFTPINYDIVKGIRENNIQKLSELFLQSEFDNIFNDFIGSYDIFLNAGYKMGFGLSDEMSKEFMNNQYLQDLLKELTRGILQIKKHEGHLVLRIGFEYFESDFGTRTRLSSEIPKIIEDFTEKIREYIVSK